MKSFSNNFETKLNIKMDVAKVHVRFRREAFKASVLARWVWVPNMAPQSRELRLTDVHVTPPWRPHAET